MEFDNRNKGTLFVSRSTAKTDYNGKLDVNGVPFVIFGTNKTVNRKSDGQEFKMIELSIIPDRNQQQAAPTPPQQQNNNSGLPF